MIDSIMVIGDCQNDCNNNNIKLLSVNDDDDDDDDDDDSWNHFHGEDEQERNNQLMWSEFKFKFWDKLFTRILKKMLLLFSYIGLPVMYYFFSFVFSK